MIKTTSLLRMHGPEPGAGPSPLEDGGEEGVADGGGEDEDGGEGVEGSEEPAMRGVG
jgi:hypothetical protein